MRTDLGILRPADDGSFSAGDVRTARVVQGLERAGLPLEAIAKVLEQGISPSTSSISPFRSHAQRRPSLLWQEPCQCGEEGPIRGPIPRPGNVSTEHGDLVAQDQQLDLLRAVAPSSRYDQLEESSSAQ